MPFQPGVGPLLELVRASRTADLCFLVLPYYLARIGALAGCERLCYGACMGTEKRPWRQRGSSWYVTPQWKALRRAQLRKCPQCVECGRSANTVDHIQPHRGDRRLFYDPTNLQSMCRTCHNVVKRRDEMGDPNRGSVVSGFPRDPAHLWNRDDTDA